MSEFTLTGWGGGGGGGGGRRLGQRLVINILAGFIEFQRLLLLCNVPVELHLTTI